MRTDDIPRLVLGGAPKSGTSTLYRWLCDHPLVRGTVPKEPHLLLEAGHPLAHYGTVASRGWGAYRDVLREGHGLVLDGSTHYLFSSAAPQHLSELPECPLVIFLLRNPADRIYSSFAYTKHQLGRLPESLSFTEYAQRLVDGSIHEISLGTHPASAYVLARELSNSDYAEHLRRWFAALGPERILVFLTEQLRSNPGSVLHDICAAAGLEPEHYHEYGFEAANVTSVPKWPVANAGLRRLAGFLPRGPWAARLKAAYRSIAVAPAPPRLPEDREAIALLDQHFAEPVRRLERLLGRPLDEWKGDRQ